MWRLRLRLDSRKQLLGTLAMKYGVSMTGYPLSYYKDERYLYLISAGILFGEERNKRALIRDLKRNPDVVKFEREGDFIINVTRQPFFSEPVYDPEIIRSNPVVINKDGYHVWDLASFNRKVLERVLKFAEKRLGAKIIGFRQEKISNINFTKLLPELTVKQKRAMDIAINAGYYEYPKRVKMEVLAKKMGISYSTYQAHLKKAEGKILPEVLKEL